MIRVTLEQLDFYGTFSARTEGHARTDVCLAVSTAIHGFAAQLEQLAKVYPTEIEIVGVFNGPLPGFGFRIDP